MQNSRRGGLNKLIRQKRRALWHTMRSYLHTSEGRPARDERTAQANFQETKPGGFGSCGGGILYLLLSQPELGKRSLSEQAFSGSKQPLFLSQACTRAAFLRGGRKFQTRQKDRKGIYPGLLLDFTTVCTFFTLWRANTRGFSRESLTPLQRAEP